MFHACRRYRRRQKPSYSCEASRSRPAVMCHFRTQLRASAGGVSPTARVLIGLTGCAGCM